MVEATAGVLATSIMEEVVEFIHSRFSSERRLAAARKAAGRPRVTAGPRSVVVTPGDTIRLTCCVSGRISALKLVSYGLLFTNGKMWVY